MTSAPRDNVQHLRIRAGVVTTHPAGPARDLPVELQLAAATGVLTHRGYQVTDALTPAGKP